MEGFFCLGLQFFCQKCGQGGGQCQDPPYSPHEIGKEVADFQRPAAHRHKVQPRAPQDGQHIVDAHRAVPRPQGVAEQGKGDQQPEEEIQHRAQKGQVQPGAEDAEKIIQHPHQGPDGQRTEQGGRLPGHRDLHLSGTAGRTVRPSPGRCPRRTGRQWSPLPSNLPRPD